MRRSGRSVYPDGGKVRQRDHIDIFFYEAFEEETEALTRALPERLSAGYTWKTVQESRDTAPPAPLVSIRTQSRIPEAWADRLTGILSRSTGYDHVLAYLEACGVDIPCGHLPLYCNRAVAEQAMLMWMALLRKLPIQTDRFARFARDGLTGGECLGKTLLVVGVGNVGFEVVKIGRGLGMDVLGIDIVERHPSVTYVSIDEGLAKADIIVCCMNLTEENREYFHYERLKKAGKGVLFINVARGEMSPSRGLLRLLDEGHLGGVGLDVYDRESELAVSLRSGRELSSDEILATLELHKRSDVILTPHNAFNTREALLRKAEHSVAQVVGFLEHGQFRWPVPVDHATRKH